jgi:hypothetical protein
MLIATSLGYSVRGRLAVVQFTGQCSLLHWLLLAHSACSLNARQAKNLDGTNGGIRSVAVEWSLLCHVKYSTLIIELTNNRVRAAVYLYRNTSFLIRRTGWADIHAAVCLQSAVGFGTFARAVLIRGRL